MRALTSTMIVITGIILAHILWKPALNYTFNRDQPPTPADWAPRYWTMHAGVRTEGPWT